MGDAAGLEVCYGGAGGSFSGRVVGDDEELAVGRSGEGGQCGGGFVSGITDSGDDRVVGLTDICFDEAGADTAVCTRNEDCCRHDET